jgi:hypothetical protein
MGMRSALQEFFGEKFFRDKVTFDKDVTCKKDVVWKRTPTLYSPVASEPSLGTLHMLPSPSAYNALYGGTQTAFTDVDVSALVPVGTKAVLIQLDFVGTRNATGTDGYTIMRVRKNGSATTGDACPHLLVRHGGASGEVHGGAGQLVVEVDTSRILEYLLLQSSAASPIGYITVQGYFC